jgi:hypothetical protein
MCLPSINSSTIPFWIELLRDATRFHQLHSRFSYAQVSVTCEAVTITFATNGELMVDELSTCEADLGIIESDHHVRQAVAVEVAGGHRLRSRRRRYREFDSGPECSVAVAEHHPDGGGAATRSIRPSRLTSNTMWSFPTNG